jgi:hypothetical protein
MDARKAREVAWQILDDFHEGLTARESRRMKNYQNSKRIGMPPAMPQQGAAQMPGPKKVDFGKMHDTGERRKLVEAILAESIGNTTEE